MITAADKDTAAVGSAAVLKRINVYGVFFLPFITENVLMKVIHFSKLEKEAQGLD